MVETLLRLGADPDYEETYYQIHQTDGSGDTLIPAYRFPADEFQGGALLLKHAAAATASSDVQCCIIIRTNSQSLL